MSNESMSVFGGANLPASSAFTSALREQSSIGCVILKMSKLGKWSFGTDNTKVEPGTKWVVNPLTFVKGYICWGDGEVLGEEMVSVTDPLPKLPPAPAESEKGWQFQRGFNLLCASGEDKGTEARWSASATGAVRAIEDLQKKVAEQIEKDPANPAPIIELGNDSYTHKKYGEIVIPVLKVVGWTPISVATAPKDADEAEYEDADADEAPAAQAEAPAEPERRRRRRE